MGGARKRYRDTYLEFCGRVSLERLPVAMAYEENDNLGLVSEPETVSWERETSCNNLIQDSPEKKYNK